MTVYFGELEWQAALNEIQYPVFNAVEAARPGTHDIIIHGDVERAMMQDYTLTQDFASWELASQRIRTARGLAMQSVLLIDQHAVAFSATVGGVAPAPISPMANGEYRVMVKFRIAVDWSVSIEDIDA